MTSNTARHLAPSAEQFAQLFPFHIAFDDDLCITQFGAAMARISPNLRVGDNLRDILVLDRPHGVLDSAFIQTQLQQLFVCRRLDGLRLRGQMIRIAPQTIFLCSPWLLGVGALGESGLTFNDFALHDSIPELIQVLESQRIATQDLRHLATRLEKQRGDLRDANARLQLKEAEGRKLALIAAHTDNGVAMADARGHIEWANESLTRMMGVDTAALIGRHVRDVFGAGDEQALRVIDEQLAREGEAFELEVEKAHSSGRRYWAHIEVQPVVDDARVTHIMAIERDISDARHRDVALQAAVVQAELANNTKTEFLAHVSHELRTPLNAIVGLSELLRDAANDPQQRDLLSTVLSSSESLLHIVNDLLDISKIESGQIVLEEGDFDAVSVCADAVSFVRGNGRVALSFSHGPGEIPVLRGDVNRLRQILVNLLGNALKFTVEGGVSLRLDWRFDGQRCALKFVVDDTGIGISDEVCERIFEKFFRVDRAEVRRTGGLGLGLSISKLLASAMGGQLHAEPRPVGSRFTLELSLPCVDVIAPEPALARRVLLLATTAGPALADVIRSTGADVVVAASTADVSDVFDFVVVADGNDHDVASFVDGDATRVFRVPSASNGIGVVIDGPMKPSRLRGLWLGALSTTSVRERPTRGALRSRVLIVDDNADSQRYVQLVLRREGFTVSAAGTVAEAISLATSSTFDLILMDISLPDGSGVEAAKALRANDDVRSRPPTPIVALSAHALRRHRDEAFAAGVVDYVTKPVRPATLIDVVVRHSARQASPPSEPATDASPICVEIDADVATLADGYLAGVRAQLDIIDRSIATGNLEQVRTLGHNLSGTGGMYGFTSITEFGKRLEVCANAAEVDALSGIASAFRMYLQRLTWRVSS
jgi:two-component system sensor histidine kinase/response regulator